MVGQGSGQRATGLRLFWQQCAALLTKNWILSIRNKRATLLQLAASFFFIFLIFAVDKAIQASNRNTTGYKNLRNPEAKAITPIPACESGFYIKSDGENPCYDFLYSGNGSLNVRTIVQHIMSRNLGRVIPDKKVMGFATPADVDEWLLNNTMRTPGALHFQEYGPNVIAYGLQTNSTAKQQRGKYEDQVFKFRMPLQAAAEREIARFIANDDNLGWDVRFTEFAHPAIDTFSTVGTIGPTFLLAAAMFGFVIQISNLVTERELKLRQAMSLMGLIDSAYWLTWLVWEVALTLVSSILLVIFGMIFQFDFFLNNDFLVLFFLFFLFQVNMTGFAFMISTFITKAASATTAGFFIFIVGFLTQLVTAFGFPYDSGPKSIENLWSLFPPNLLAIGLSHLGEATATKEDNGISWSRRYDCYEQNTSCAITMGAIYNWLLVLFLVWFTLAIYFDNILPDVNGVRKPCFYFVWPSYWTGRANNATEGGGCCSCTSSLPPVLSSEYSEDVDVLAEKELVQQQPPVHADDPNIAVQVRGLVKTFPGVSTLGCCKCVRTPAFHAVKGTWFNIEKDKLFCLLGPNGAGKTTTINCLTGIIPTTSGDGLIYGQSIRDPAGISRIRSFMGVCPQFDILWESLSGQEHLHLFANIKGIPRSDIKSVADELLAQVKLSDAANVRSGSFSGGMKRRLSVAIALIGDPKIVFLDEPTTGMDPITRRYVWDIIEVAKKGRAIVLTTHSMEEADILGDRIAIMAKGQLRCIGTSIHLKSRFGSGYVVNVSVRKATRETLSPEEDTRRRANVRKYFLDGLGVVPSEENKAYISFIVPRKFESKLTEFFLGLHECERELGVTDIQLSLTTLDEVFLNIARQAELETATVEGRYELLTVTPTRSVQVPIGAQFVAIPGTESADAPYGLMVEVHWQQDDTGALKISAHSEMKPAPAPQAGSSSSELIRNTSRRSLTRRSGKAPSIGRSIDPSVVASG